MTESITAAQKKDLVNMLKVAWGKYTDIFSEPPHGTEKQLAALVELMPLATWVGGIRRKAIAEHFTTSVFEDQPNQ